ncbi:hypothetical protein HYT84_03045 [Candidatus Micrarchaeota archaeon]|nr:hypothetical protein [Candidatus Micrarchaeota archaeon]
MGKDIPEWFIWTTTIGLVFVVLLLWANYTSMNNLTRMNYAMMQGNADMNMMNSGMMKMMGKAMMSNKLMDSDEFEKMSKVYSTETDTNEFMRKMMGDEQVDETEVQEMMQKSTGSKTMMGGMMK